ncbi:hypothetical protein WKR88_15815 [Trinickia caryophylli]|uniref:Uncharacterized protein n=1 Tax=Trinickia caryophylli TaxID=28094 RepID=A0A1X7D2P7_TRICW|nr:hypothetical protein [Trinickia caryophylli]PMS12790.1 hypothetical protein C0Z17_08220 [Trinickia caryophylli]TRX15205.1 hypothetical protein FNF07_28890 [Trinickia caryophylli]WQE15075.1 hypothetical protein U0034_21210 [Trinickia caryophylli]SMF07644.1 hypothetical protein SAMN06295900_102318 [Trinickia caryophylli]GLU31192.1 hypothetical protein Busp01_10340 [Trinickia caryophylli]
MQEELNSLHEVASKLLSNHLGNWANAVTNATAGHDDSKFLGVVHALLSIRSALAPLVSQSQDSSHG